MDDSKCDCHLHFQQVCDICQGITGDEVDNILEMPNVKNNLFELPNTREGLTQLIENTVGKQFLVGFVDADGNMRYTIGDDLTTADLLMLLEHIKMTFVYGID